MGFAAVVCAFGVLTATASAKKPVKEVTFGKFTASIEGQTISPSTPAGTKAKGAVVEGEVPGVALAGSGLVIEACPLKAKGQVDSESSETLLQVVSFDKCKGEAFFGENKKQIEKYKVPNFSIAIEFHSNKSGVIGESESSEVKIVSKSTIVIPVRSKHIGCEVTIPEQTIPTRAVTRPAAEYESAYYETEDEAVEGKKGLERFPSGFQEKLNVETEFSKVETWVKPSESCEYIEGEEGAYDNTVGTPAYGYVVYSRGILNLELEDITIKNGNIGFAPV
jgi:hypothetical protein